MIATTLATLFTVMAIATALALVDFWLRARDAYVYLGRQRALIKAGFVPQVEAQVVRLRPTATRFVGGTTRPFAKRLPVRPPVGVRGAA